MTRHGKSDKKTSPGLAELLKRNGKVPTGDSEKDIAAAKRFMPRGYKD